MVRYDRNLLTSPKNSKKYNSNNRQALNLGIYSTDLGYANIYEQTQDALNHLTNVREMAEKLKIAQLIDFNIIKDLAIKSDNLASFLLLTNTNLEGINNHLQEIGRADLTILIIV